MIDVFRPRRCRLYRRLWRCRTCPEAQVKVKGCDVEEIQRQKSFLRLLTRSLTTAQLETLTHLVERHDDRACLPVSEIWPAGSSTSLVDRACRLWRPGWTTLDAADSTHSLCKLPICHCESVICLNPFHWGVNVTSAISEYSSGLSPAIVPRTDSVCDDCSSDASAEPWCRITYHQYREHVGTPGGSLPVHSRFVHVFSGLHHGTDGLCLSALRATSSTAVPRPPPAWSSAAERALAKVGRGVTLERSSTSAWLHNRGEFAVFVMSPSIRVVRKLLPGQSACVYSWRHDGHQPDQDRKSDSSVSDFDCILISFVKGWSGRYKRQTILSCPCWLQVLLARTPHGGWNEDATVVC